VKSLETVAQQWMMGRPQGRQRRTSDASGCGAMQSYNVLKEFGQVMKLMFVVITAACQICPRKTRFAGVSTASCASMTIPKSQGPCQQGAGVTSAICVLPSVPPAQAQRVNVFGSAAIFDLGPP